MPTRELKCDCGKRLAIFMPRRNGTATQELTQGYEAGWIIRNGVWFCSSDCVANAATDITPKSELLTDVGKSHHSN